MQLRLKSRKEVWLFALSVTGVAVMGNFLAQKLMFPPDLARDIAFNGSLIAAILALPISFYVGVKIQEVNDLTSRLESAVDFDLLTGTSTRLSFYRQVETQSATPMAIIVADIDHFKAINDRFGHPGGDVALRMFAQTLVRNCREDDIVARFGGEEFVILLQMAGLEEGLAAARRLCQRVREKSFEIHGTRARITASFGVATLEDPANIDDAIHRADIAVYRAKESGRNQVCAFDPEIDRQATLQTAAE